MEFAALDGFGEGALVAIGGTAGSTGDALAGNHLVMDMMFYSRGGIGGSCVFKGGDSIVAIAFAFASSAGSAGGDATG